MLAEAVMVRSGEVASADGGCSVLQLNQQIRPRRPAPTCVRVHEHPGAVERRVRKSADLISFHLARADNAGPGADREEGYDLVERRSDREPWCDAGSDC